MNTVKYLTRKTRGASNPMTPSDNRLPAYLASLGISERESIDQRDMDFLAEENQDGAGKTSLELPEFIRQMQGTRLDRTDGSDCGSDVTDPTLVFALWRLQYWMNSACGIQMQHAEVQRGFAAIDERLSTPPIRRTPMPVARLESPRFTSGVRSLLDKAISVRVAAVQTFRRLVMQA
ncbi:MAG: hypothetical protein ABFS45_05840 [Pseudomonadota bacterium]